MEWLKEKHKYIIIATLIAILLWFYVNNQNNNFPVLFSDLKKSFLLDLETENLSSEYKIKKISNRKVVIKLEEMPFFHNYKKEDFTAYIDLSGVNKGENIRIVKINTPPNIKIKEIDPEFIKITIDNK